MRNKQLENQLKQGGRTKKGKAKAAKSQSGDDEARLNDPMAKVGDLGRQFAALFEIWPDKWWWVGAAPTVQIVEKHRYDRKNPKYSHLFQECVRAELWLTVPPAFHRHIQLSAGFQKEVRCLPPNWSPSEAPDTDFISSRQPAELGLGSSSWAFVATLPILYSIFLTWRTSIGRRATKIGPMTLSSGAK